MNPTAYYTKNPDFIQREVAGECILVPLKKTAHESGSLYVLNEMAAWVWNNLDGNRTLNQIKAELLSEYDVAENNLESDLQSLFQDLTSIQAIQEKT
ncbi:MAG: PqqD family protein [Candidatus Omnitrophica bacterium]|nr:PqqD family protein [Candidatus Omnitrophota bacterium]